MELFVILHLIMDRGRTDAVRRFPDRRDHGSREDYRRRQAHRQEHRRRGCAPGRG